MTLPKSQIVKKVFEWFSTPLGGVALAIVGAGIIAFASKWFVTHDVMASEVSRPLAALQTQAQGQEEAISTLAKSTASLEEEKRRNADRIQSEAEANRERDKIIRSLVEASTTLAQDLRTYGEKTRAQEAQIIALQTATASVRTEIAVVQTNQIAAAKQSDRIEDKLDRLIENRGKPPK